MNFLANENFPLVSIKLLRASGYKVASVIEETPGIKDYDILKRAHQEGLLILTFDRDYGELMYRHTSLPPAGIVYFRFKPSSPEEPSEILLNILNKRDKISLSGEFTIIERGRIRQRKFSKNR